MKQREADLTNRVDAATSLSQKLGGERRSEAINNLTSALEQFLKTGDKEGLIALGHATPMLARVLKDPNTTGEHFVSIAEIMNHTVPSDSQGIAQMKEIKAHIETNSVPVTAKTLSRAELIGIMIEKMTEKRKELLECASRKR